MASTCTVLLAADLRQNPQKEERPSHEIPIAKLRGERNENSVEVLRRGWILQVPP